MSPSLPLASEPDFEEGALIDRWRVLERVDSGSYGVVYRVVPAEQPWAGAYALKLAKHPEDERFEREAVLLSRIRHPAVPRLHSQGVWRDALGQRYPYLVMQWVEGVVLYDWASKRGFTSRQVLRLLAEVARGLEATHQHGVHRDVKGDNVLVGKDGRAVLVDFGAGWYPGARPLTDTAIPPGTEPYRSHQLIRFRYKHRRDLEARYDYQPQDDLYALGVMAYRLVTNTYPPAPTDPECADDPERLPPAKLVAPREAASVVPVLDQLIRRMLSEAPSVRGTACELAQKLEQAAADAGPEADLPIVLDPSMRTTERAARPGPPRWHRRALALLKRWRIPTAAVAVVGLASVVALHFDDEPPRLACGEEPGISPDKETVGLGDSPLVSAAPLGDVSGSARAVGLDMPNGPLKGQKRPPCKRGEIELNGGCWVKNASEAKPPCDRDWYEWQGECYWPLITPERRPTSEDP